METLPAFFLQPLFLAVMGWVLVVFCAVWVLFRMPLRIIGQRRIPRALWSRLLVLHSLALSVILGLLLWPVAHWVYLIFLGYDTSQYRALQLSVLVFVGAVLLVFVLFAVLYDGEARRFWLRLIQQYEKAILFCIPKTLHNPYQWHVRWRFVLLGGRVVRWWRYVQWHQVAVRLRPLALLLAAVLTLFWIAWLIPPSSQSDGSNSHAQTTSVLHTLQQHLQQIFSKDGIWSLQTLLAGAIIAFVLWWFRNNNQLWQIENQRKDTNLKDFQQLSAWASGLHLQNTQPHSTQTIGTGATPILASEASLETPAHAPSDQSPDTISNPASLQIAAVVQLQAFLRGEYGAYFQGPAFALLTSIWQTLMQAHEAAWQADFDKDTREQWCAQVRHSANRPLARAITQVLACDAGRILRQHKTQLPGLGLTGMNTRLPGLQAWALNGLDLNGIRLQSADLSDAQLQGADLRGAQLQGAYLRDAKLQGAYLFDTQLQDADLSLAQLQGADLIQAKLQGADLSGAQLQGADLNVAQLQGANLRFSKLQGADLLVAQLQSADLSGAQLQGANLFDAQLQGADLRYAQFQGTDLRVAKLQGATFHNVVFDTQTRFHQATTDDNTNLVMERGEKILPLRTHAMRLKLRRQNGLILPKAHYSEYRAQWQQASRQQRRQAWEQAGSEMAFDTDPQ